MTHGSGTTHRLNDEDGTEAGEDARGPPRETRRPRPAAASHLTDGRRVRGSGRVGRVSDNGTLEGGGAGYLSGHRGMTAGGRGRALTPPSSRGTARDSRRDSRSTRVLRRVGGDR